MTPRHSRPEGAEKRLEEAVRAAKRQRDKAVRQAETTFWTEIAELKQSYRGAHTDIASVLGVTRDAILKSVKKYANDGREE
ncbi:glutamyl-tRNA reductase [Streptomyces ambofaciens]